MSDVYPSTMILLEDADMLSPATVIANYMQAQGIGTIGTDLSIGGVPERVDSVISVVDSPAHASPHPNVPEESPTVKILVRERDYDAGYSQCKAITDLLQSLPSQDIDGKRVISCLAVGSPNWLGWDDNNRGQWSMNFNLIRSRA